MPPRSTKNESKRAIILATPSSVYSTEAPSSQKPSSRSDSARTTATNATMRLPEPHTATAMISSGKSGSLSTKGKILNVTNVRDLSKVKKLYDSDEPMVILVYRDTCGFCEMMKPAWIAFSPEAVTKGVHVVNIDSSVLDAVPSQGKSEFVNSLKKSFEGFVPFVMKMKGPNDHAVYNGNRTPEDFAKFALKKKKNSRSQKPSNPSTNKK